MYGGVRRRVYRLGMGYKADEQVSPYVAKSVRTVEAQEQGEGLGEGTLTFYGQLRKRRPDIMIPKVEATQPPEAAPAELTLEPTPNPRAVAAHYRGRRNSPAGDRPNGGSDRNTARCAGASPAADPSGTAGRGGKNEPGAAGDGPNRRALSGHQ